MGIKKDFLKIGIGRIAIVRLQQDSYFINTTVAISALAVFGLSKLMLSMSMLNRSLRITLEAEYTHQ
jgi:hypothetical protein